MSFRKKIAAAVIAFATLTGVGVVSAVPASSAITSTTSDAHLDLYSAIPLNMVDNHGRWYHIRPGDTLWGRHEFGIAFTPRGFYLPARCEARVKEYSGRTLMSNRLYTTPGDRLNVMPRTNRYYSVFVGCY